MATDLSCVSSFFYVLMIEILYAHFPDKLPPSLWQQYLSCLPKTFQESTARFRRWQDQHAHALGKLLLKLSLEQRGYPSNVLTQLKYTPESRPYLAGNVDFNISHTGNHVVCAVSTEITLGIDIELVNTIDFNDFQITMNESQWVEIKANAEPTRKFFEYWTLKESLIKADGRGLGIPLTELSWKDNQLTYDGLRWYFQPVHIADEIPCHLASNVPDSQYTLTKIDFLDPVYLEKLSS